MATPVNCSLTCKDFFCSHDICRIVQEAEEDYDNAIERGLDKDQQREYAIKVQDAFEPIWDLWEIFEKRDVNLVPPEWKEVYFKYLKKDLEKQETPRIS
jgi:hypothetical protein